MSTEIPDLTPPWTLWPTVHEDTFRLNEPTMDAISADVAADISNPASAIGGALSATFGTVITPHSHGAVGDGLADDTAALQATFDAAVALWTTREHGEEKGAKVTADLGGWTYRVTDTLVLDLAKVRVVGAARIKCAINDPAKYLLAPISSDNFGWAAPHYQRNGGIEGIIFEGDGVTNGLLMDGSSGAELSHLSFVACMWNNFTTAIYFGTHTYMVSFVRCSIQGNLLAIHHDSPAASNSGERFVFTDCDITGNQDVFNLNSSQALHFNTCSMSFNIRSIGRTTNGQVYVNGGHIETDNPMDAGFILTDLNAVVFLTDVRMLVSGSFATIGGATKTIDTAGQITATVRHYLKVGDQTDITVLTGAAGLTSGRYFVVQATDYTIKVSATLGGAAIMPSTAGTLSMKRWSENPMFRFDHGNAEAFIKGGHISGSSLAPYLSKGAGRIHVRGTRTYNTTPYQPITNDQATGQAIADPKFNSGATIKDSWAKTNATDTFATSTVNPYEGARAMRFTRVDPGLGASYLSLTIPIQPSNRILPKFKMCLPAGVTVPISYHYANENGVLEASMATSNPVGTGAYVATGQPTPYYRQSPPFARQFIIRFNMQNLAVGQTVDLDDLEIGLY